MLGYAEDYADFYLETKKTIKEAEDAKTLEELKAVVLKLAKHVSVLADEMAASVGVETDDI